MNLKKNEAMAMNLGGSPVVVEAMTDGISITDFMKPETTVGKADVKPCHCCGEPRPYPRSEGLWEFMESPTFSGSEWVRVKVVASKTEPGCFELYMEGEPDPVWWPDNAKWRKVPPTNPPKG